MGDKVLVKADVTQFQTVGQGSPSIRDLFNAVRGRGTKQGSKVGIKGRAAGLAGLAGKGAAAAATALSTADAMQGGNIAAPLGAGYTFQGLDPTGKLTGEAIEGNKHRRRGRFSGGRNPAVALPVPGMANNEGGKPLPLPPNTPRQMPLPTPVAPAPAATPIPVPLPTATAAPAAPAATPIPVPLPTAPAAPAATATMQPQPLQPAAPIPPLPVPAPAAPAAPVAPTAQGGPYGVSPASGEPMVNSVQGGQGQFGVHPPSGKPMVQIVGGGVNLPPQMKTKAFNGMLFDLLGPDNLYKMTPNEIGELAAYMYIKTR
jgi:hypothetical protein